MSVALRGIVLLVVASASVAVAQSRTRPAPSTYQSGQSERSFWEIHADARIIAYEVAHPRSPVRYSRRRLVQQTGLEHVLVLGEERQWRLVSHLQVRLDQELGSVCLRGTDTCIRETDDDARRDFQLLVRNSRLDMPRVWLGLQGPGLNLRLGRVVVFDASGFARVDGGRVELNPHAWVSIRAYGGRRTTDASFAATPGLQTQGSIQIGLPEDFSPERAPFAFAPSRTWVLGGAVDLHARGYGVEGGWREVQDQSGIVARRTWVAARARIAALGLRGSAVWDPTDGTMVDGSAEASVQLGRFTTRAVFERHVPRFDLGSIWSWFTLVPVDRATVGVDWRADTWRMGALARARRTVDDQNNEADFGGEVYANFRRRSWHTSMRAFVWAGDLQPMAALFLDVRRRISMVEVYARGSLWHFDHPFQDNLYGLSTATAIGTRVNLTDNTLLQADVEWAHNRVVGHRIRGLVGVTVRAWR